MTPPYRCDVCRRTHTSIRDVTACEDGHGPRAITAEDAQRIERAAVASLRRLIADAGPNGTVTTEAVVLAYPELAIGQAT